MSATTTATMTASPEAKPKVPYNKDSMKSTWRTDKSQWGRAHYILDFFNAYETELDVPVPVFKKTDKVPYLSELSVHKFIVLHALWPLAVQYIYYFITGNLFHPVAALFLYMYAYKANAIHSIRLLRRLTHQCGFLDGDAYKRDSVPDQHVDKVLWSVEMTTTLRPIFTVYLAYNRTQLPGFTPWLLVELAIYGSVLDFFFYTYHRSCHEIEALWKFHRTHHLTKHPVPLLSAFADIEQEAIEMVLIPLATYFTLRAIGLPMNFYDWWLCQEYVTFSEGFGHSGLRAYSTVASVGSPILKALGCELVIEDHDLHHRKGWKKAANYGKQTRLWDRIFGTCGERIELKPENIDYSRRVNMPLW